MTKAEVEELLFPSDPDEYPTMFENFRRFLIHYYHHWAPRSKLTGDKISYRALASARDSLMFWLRYTYHLRKVEVPSPAMANRATTEAIRAVVKLYPDQAAKEVPTQKPYLGLNELRQLFDFEMVNNRSIEYSEQHQVAWCIARLTACRPGSICTSGKKARGDALMWKDLQFEVVSYTSVPFLPPNHVARLTFIRTVALGCSSSPSTSGTSTSRSQKIH